MELKNFMRDKRNAIIGLLVVFLCGFGLGYGVSLANRHEGVAVDRGDWTPLKEGEHHACFTRCNDSIWGGYIDSLYTHRDLHYCSFVDKGSLLVSRSSDYAKDKNHVYYPLIVDYLGNDDPNDFTTVAAVRVVKCVIEDANPASFKVIGNGYAVDSNRMYYKGREMPWDNEVIRSQGKSCTGDEPQMYVEPIPDEFLNM